MSYWTRDTSSSEGTGEFAEEYRLVVRARGGDQVAFEALYEHYNDRICRYLSRMVGNDGIGCELTQETFLKAWEGLPGLRVPERFASWLYRIATNCAYTYQHRAKNLHMVPWETYKNETREQSVSGPEQQVEETELLKMALAHVSPTYRSCLILYVVEELPQRKIADLLKMKESSVSKYVSRGKEELRQIYHHFLQEQHALTKGRS